LPDPPAALNALGKLAHLERPMIAIVGARASTAAGREIARRLGRDLAAEGITIVSGMARGIDAAGHRGALDATGATVAVLGTGIDRCYPPEERELYERLSREGLLLSEFEPGELPLRFHFPKRNRIIAALAVAVIVVEGSRRSGSRITADIALDLGREVLAVPRDPLAPGAEMPNALLKQGAAPITNANDVVEMLGPSENPEGSRAGAPRATRRFPDRLAWLGRHLETSPQGADELARASRRPVAEVLSALVDLEFRGVVERVGGALFRLRGDS